ncbi:MAG TPA: 16S rRNA methyltransferase [Thiothrix sp.]|nr:16S rRNA methyltransferase [Thiothrix sp.]
MPKASNTVPHDTQADYLLDRSEQGLILRDRAAAFSPIGIDFTTGKYQHRRLQGGGKGQAIAKAVGLHKYPNLHVLDATAGLGRDAFVLASLGCTVTLVERHPMIYALLADAWQRLQQNAAQDLQAIAQRMQLRHQNAIDYLEQLRLASNDQGLPEVIYLDPMFPERKKKAQVKKEMQCFHQLVGQDQDSVLLLEKALQTAQRRIVVKRPRLAEPLADKLPAFVITGKSTRYDVYLPSRDH